MTTVYVQRAEAEIDENSQQLVWLDRKPEPFQESDFAVWSSVRGAITDLESARRIVPLQKYAGGIEVDEVIFID